MKELGPPAPVRGQRQSVGLEGCHLSTFQATSSSRTSVAYLFRDVKGATQGLPVLRDVARKGLDDTSSQSGAKIEARRDVPVSGLGDQSLPGITFTASGGGTTASLRFYVWRSRNVVFFFLSVDPPAVKESALLDLARKMASRAAA